MAIRPRRRTLACAALCACLAGCGTRHTPPPPPPRPAAPAAPGVLQGTLRIAPPARLQTAAIILAGERGAGVPTDAVDIEPDGRFVFRDVPPGAYQLRARARTERDERTLYGRLRVIVVADPLPPLVVELAPGAEVSGHVDGLRGAADGVQVAAVEADGTRFGRDGDAVRAPLDRRGSFVLDGVVPGPFVLRLDGLPHPWIVDRVLHRGRDVADEGLEARSGEAVREVRIVLAPNGGGIAGRVIGAPDGVDVAIVIVGVAEARCRPASRRVRMAAVDGARRYSVGGLLPGEYRAAALPRGDALAPAACAAILREGASFRSGPGASGSLDVPYLGRPARP